MKKEVTYFLSRLIFDKKRDLKVEGKKVLIADCQKIGNYILKTPMIKGLALAGYEISILGSVLTKELAETNPYIKEVIIDNCYRKKSSDIFRNIKTGLKYRGKFDYFIELVGGTYLRDFVLMNLLKAKKIIGIERKKERKCELIDIIIKRQPHMREDGIEVLKVLGLNTFFKNGLKVYENNTWVGAGLTESIEKYDIYLKNGNKYQDLCKKKPLVLYNGNASTIDRSIPKKREKEILGNLSLIDGVEIRKIEHEDSILDLCALIERADVVVSVDTGITHIASAFNIPIVVHSSPTHTFPTSDIVIEHSFFEKDLYKVVKKTLKDR